MNANWFRISGIFHNLLLRSPWSLTSAVGEKKKAWRTCRSLNRSDVEMVYISQPRLQWAGLIPGTVLCKAEWKCGLILFPGENGEWKLFVIIWPISSSAHLFGLKYLLPRHQIHTPSNGGFSSKFPCSYYTWIKG